MFAKSKPKLKKALCKFLILAMIFSLTAGNGLLKSQIAKAEENAAQSTIKQAAPAKTDTKDASVSDDSADLALQKSDDTVKLQQPAASQAQQAEDKNPTTEQTADIDENTTSSAVKISVYGITDNEVTTNSSIEFTVSAASNTGNKTSLIVELNGEIISANDDGKYTASLNAGENTIFIEAKDLSNNRVSIAYKITYNPQNNLRQKVEQAIEGACSAANSRYNSLDWVAIGFARAGKSDLISKDYLKNTEEYLKNPDNQETFEKKPTEYERITLGVMAAGGDPANIGGINLIDKICNAELDKQGINAEVFGLIALDSKNYAVPDGAEWNREKLINAILNNECTNEKNVYGKKAGWAFGSNNADPDMTGMAMTALAPYNNDDYPEVKAAVERAAKWLSYAQGSDGGYASYGTANSESCAQVIMGLCACGINPTGDKFTKNNHNVIDGILNFEVPNHGGFMHVTDPECGGGMVNGMANEQALYALDQYIYFLDGKGSIYEWEKPTPVQKSISIIRTGDGSLKKGTRAEAAFNITNNQSNDQNVTLLVVLYNKDTNEMIDYSYIEKILKGESTEKFAGGFSIPSDGNYLVKGIVCDDLDSSNMNLLSNSAVIDVE